jgi:hypothetical protein
MREITDTDRLDWLAKFADKGVIRLDYDLEGCPVIFWSVFNDGEGFTNPRDAIDAAMIQGQAELHALEDLQGE